MLSYPPKERPSHPFFPASAVQPHLRKCFEAIETLDFAPNLEISAMNSKEKEKVPFDKTMFPTGNVEVWLGERERGLLGG